jgi:electron transfer flavoprotein beta subunit
MRIAVCVKEVLDARVPVSVVGPNRQIAQPTGEIRLINPADRAAIEVALSLKTSATGDVCVQAFSVAKAGFESALHHALARGVDTAERLEPWADPRTPVSTALALAHRFAEGDDSRATARPSHGARAGPGGALSAPDRFDLILFGDETLDNASAMVGPLTAELLSIAQVTSVSKLERSSPDTCVMVRKLDRGRRERVEARLPLVVTFVPEAMPPKYVSERLLERARAMPIRVVPVPHVNGGAGVPAWPESEKPLAPRARIKKRFAPDAKLSAADRVQAIMSGGAGDKTASSANTVIDGETDYVVEQLYRFMKHHEFV